MFAKTAYTFCFILLLPILGYGQNTIGLPDVINYNKSNYNAGLQNWDIKQDKNGIIYVANNEGLLTFDGKYWNIYPLTNKTIVRSVEIGADNRIYVGGQDELGYFAPDDYGRLKYSSLTALIPKQDRAFGDVWDIAAYKNELFFRSTNKIFRYANESMSVFYSPGEWSYMGVCNNRLYAHDHKNGLLYFENNVWAPVQTTTPFSINSPVTSILPFINNTVLITTLKNGIYVLDNNNITKLTSAATSTFEQERIYSATKINAEWTALGTSNSGVYIIDANANVVQSFAKPEGMQNNNVLSIFLDKQSNLWLGLNTGVDFIAYNSAIKRITPYAEDGSGYTALIHNNVLYTGTSAGLFSVPLQPVKDLSFSKGTFSQVANTTGQTWGLAEINGQLLLGHHEGAFIVEGNAARPIASGVGFWNFLPLSPVFPSEKIIAGNYHGLTFLNYKDNNITIGPSVPHFDESSRYIAIDQPGNIWISHPYHGVYKVTANAAGEYTAKLYNDRNGLPTALNNHVFKVKNEVLVATEKGVYIYNAATDLFEPSPFYKKILGQTSLRYLKDDTEGNTWFIHEKSLGVVDMSGKTPAVIYLPELKNKMLSGFEFMYPIDEQNIIIGGENGFFHINYEKYIKNIPELKVQLRAVRIIDKKDSLLFGGYFNANINEPQVQAKNQTPSIDNNWKTIHFEFSSPEFGQQSNLEYSYRLKGFDDNWAAWSNKTEKEYTNLGAGTYTIEIKVRNNLGTESAPVAYTFKVLPPWYQTTWANILYVLLLLAGIYIIYIRQRRKFHQQQARHDEEQKKIIYLHQLEIDKTENELVALRNEKLQAEIDFKNTELASSAMHLVQKGELLAKMKATLTQLMKVLDNDKAIAELKRMIKVLSEDDKKDKDWENFAQHFDKVNSDFVGRLKEKHSNISPNELKLCAYLRMNLSTKEIAQLMNISIRGVEISRYRLRKKLGIVTEMSLFDYFMGL